MPVGVPVSTAERCRSVSVPGGAWCAIGQTPEENRKTSNDLDPGLAPVTPEATSGPAGSPPSLTQGWSPVIRPPSTIVRSGKIGVSEVMRP